MFGFFKSKPLRDDFYQQHKLSPEQEPILNIGALLIAANNRADAVTLRSRLHPSHLTPVLSGAWGIKDTSGTKELLNELLSLPVLKKHALISSAQLSNEDLFKSIKSNCGSEIAKRNLYFSKEYFDGVKDLAAWDIERAGLVARYAFNLGWLTQDETIDYLKALHKLAAQHYTNWLDYFTGYLKGRVILYNKDIEDAYSYLFAVADFYKKDDFPCTAFPL